MVGRGEGFVARHDDHLRGRGDEQRAALAFHVPIVQQALLAHMASSTGMRAFGR
jgi:hypothetical protein